ncbi:MAG: hypothetical protein CM1200mP2_21190 [Planctomycetaceae bacterium]|nr:MAG: hypothetical protein CM1200mP2_21190 [Planctomycetaceae bacterium]
MSDDLDYKLLLTLKQGRLQLPYPSDQPRTIDHLSGQLYLDPRHPQVKTLSGRELDTTLTVNGLLELTTDPPTGRLDVALKNLAIDQRLRGKSPRTMAAAVRCVLAFGPSRRLRDTTANRKRPLAIL